MGQDQKPTEAENPAPTMEQEDMGVDFGDEGSSFEPSPEEETDASKETEDSQESETFINQEAVNKRINEITGEKYEERRKREKLQEELEALKAQVKAKSSKEEDIEIPPLPDYYDDNYEQKIKERDDIIQKLADRKAEKNWRKKQQEEKYAEQLEILRKKTAEKIQAMQDKAKKYGINEDELRDADVKVGNFIKNPDLARFIIGQSESPLIMKYLSSDYTELEKLSQMDPLDASVYIATEITSKALKLRPGVTKTPDPVDIPKGKSKIEKDPFLKGAVFE